MSKLSCDVLWESSANGHRHTVVRYKDRLILLARGIETWSKYLANLSPLSQDALLSAKAGTLEEAYDKLVEIGDLYRVPKAIREELERQLALIRL